MTSYEKGLVVLLFELLFVVGLLGIVLYYG